MVEASTCPILADVRVAELGGGISLAFCGRLLAALGADVLKVEPAGGDELRRQGPFAPIDRTREHGGLFLYLNADKRSVTLDIARLSGHQLLERLSPRVDVVLVGLSPREQRRLRLSAEALGSIRPDLIVTSLTPFGTIGPYCDFRGVDLTAIHWGGLAYLTPRLNADPGQEPLRPDGYLSEFLAGLHGALATLAAVLRHDRLGAVGAAIDISGLEAVLYTQLIKVAQRTYSHQKVTRSSRPDVAPFGFFQCRDGHVFIMATEAHQWDGLVEVMGRPQWATADFLRDRQARAESWDAIEPLIANWTRNYNAEEIFERASALRVPCAPAATVDQFVGSPHMKARGFFTTVIEPDLGEVRLPGAPVRMKATPWRLARGAPRPGEHNAEILGRLAALAGGQHGGRARSRRHLLGAPLALEGFRMLDLTSAWAGPMCTMLLADMGADVVKIESYVRPDITRRAGPFADGEPGLERSGYFASLCRGKRSLALNISGGEGQTLVKRLVPLMDVVVENFSPRVMPKLGLSYHELRALKPDIVMLSMSGYGTTGPYQDYVAYGQPLEAFTGYDRLIGYPGGPPMALGMPISDQLVGLYGALAVAGALRYRARTGRGQYIELSQCEALASVLALPLMEFLLAGSVRSPRGNRDDIMAPHNCYRCAGEDEWATIAVGSNEEWQALAAAVGHPEWTIDPRFASPQRRWLNQDILDALLAQWTATRSAAEVTALLQGAGVAAGPTAPADALVTDPHLVARGFFATVPHSVVGPRLIVGPFARSEPALAAVRSGAPLLGEHTADVLEALLGLPASEVKRLEGARVAW